MNERRVVERFNLVSQAKIKVEKLPHEVTPDSSLVRDISCDGGFFITRRLLPLGTRVSVTVTLDNSGHGDLIDQSASLLTLRGKVCRLESQGMAIRFAPDSHGENE